MLQMNNKKKHEQKELLPKILLKKYFKQTKLYMG
jgi:hypothetical protein